MNKLLIITLFLIVALGCNEIPPQIGGTSGEVINTTKKVLVEEYTGVRCGNCPAGTSLLQSLKSDLGDRLIIVSFHAGFFARPYPNSLQDFKTEETESLESLLGEPLGYPAAVVNRKLFDGDRILNSSDWAFRVEEELNVPADAEITIEYQYNEMTRSLSMEIDILALADLTENVALSAYIVEDNIVDVQATPTEIKEAYLHRAILRKVLTPINGLNTSLQMQGDREAFSFNHILDESWDVSNISIVAFVHENGADLDVIQAEEIYLSQ